MNKTTFRVLMVLIAVLMLFGIVACKEDVQPTPEPATKECTVTFDYQNGSPSTSVTVMEGEKVKQPSTDPTRDGYFFGGWWTKNNNGSYK
ncbi:MAG: InlB B-repeat-containing protein, partial [Spirochaetales bacterium]|nr:InlB B-repeat-containing protein [Spirochaetales bacterium]